MYLWSQIDAIYQFVLFALYTPGSWFNIKMLSYQYRKFHCGDKTVVRSSYLHNGISYAGKIKSLYWIRALSLDKVYYGIALSVSPCTCLSISCVLDNKRKYFLESFLYWTQGILGHICKCYWKPASHMLRSQTALHTDMALYWFTLTFTYTLLRIH